MEHTTALGQAPQEGVHQSAQAAIMALQPELSQRKYYRWAPNNGRSVDQLLLKFHDSFINLCTRALLMVTNSAEVTEGLLPDLRCKIH
eukprot:753235-Hanusia_phi.AAC.4